MTNLNKYKITGHLGDGAFGKVYKATCVSTKRNVAIKIVPLNKLSRAVTAAETDAMVKIPPNGNLVQMIDCFTEDNVIYIVMEYLPGGDLYKFIRSPRPIEEKTIWRLLTDCVSGLYHLHQKGYIHRDIKPSNILLTADDKAKFCDFGLAQKLTPGGNALGSVGTPLYMPPEVLQGRDFTDKSDIYSLGITFYELMCQQHPFLTTNHEQLLFRVKNGQFGLELPSYYSTELRWIVKAMCTTERNNRPSAESILFYSPIKHQFIGKKRDNIAEIIERELKESDKLEAQIAALRSEIAHQQRAAPPPPPRLTK